ncbi:MAG: hypothetical protein GXO75_14090 [Calditrichaeota bacterium]|nr:hypothetical protein [Calditrichota bacterium]
MFKNHWVLFLAAFVATTCIYGQKNTSVDLEPIVLSNYEKGQSFTRSIYSIDSRFSSTDTVLFLTKVKHIQIANVDSISRHEMAVTVHIDSGFIAFGRHSIVVIDTLANRKMIANLTIRYAKPPSVDEMIIKQNGRTKKDTLKLSSSGRTFVFLSLKGNGLFRTSHIQFDDPKIKTLNSPGWRSDNPPTELTVGLEIDGNDVEIGTRRFRVENEFSMEGWGEILLKSSNPPQVISRVKSFIADGLEKEFTIRGDHFYRGIRASLLPADGVARAEYHSSNQIKVYLNLPILERSQSYRLVLTNPDGQADTTSFFTVRSKPLGRARVKTIDKGSIFYGKKARVVFALDAQSGWRLVKKSFYEVNIEGNRFPVISVIDDSTCEAIILLHKDDSASLLNRHVFTINRVDSPPRWKGTLIARPAPEISYLSPLRTIHAVDTLLLVLKGKNFKNVSLYIEDPEVTFKITENRGDLIMATAIAGKFVSPDSYPLEMRIDGVQFEFNPYRIEIQPWQPFNEYVGLETTSLGFISPQKLWRGSGVSHLIEASDGINIKIFANKIREELGEQKIEISGVLMDSSNTIRAEAFDKKMISISKGTAIKSWHWRVRERVRSGDRIEITLQNPGGQNKVTETFFVKPHWSESFHGSTSFILFKMPFGGGEATTEIFRSVGIGISYIPVKEQQFLAFDGSFILGNVAKGDANLSVEVGLGLSVILWHHLQVGMGTNLTGRSFDHGFLFVGTRFKLPVPW